MNKIRSTAAICVAFLCTTLVAQAAPIAAKFHHVHLNTTDVKSSIDYYAGRFKAEPRKYIDGSDALWTGRNWILLTQVHLPPKSALITPLWHFGWGAPDMQEEVARQLAKGSRFQTPITNISRIVGNQWRIVYYAYVESPDGALIELNTARDEEFSHVHLFTTDVAATSEWYFKHLGLRKPADRPGGLNAVDQSGGEINWLIMQLDFIKRIEKQAWLNRTQFESSRGYAFDHVAFSVDDLDSALTQLKSQGVEIATQPRWQVPGKLRSAFITGPDGVAIELIEERQ